MSDDKLRAWAAVQVEYRVAAPGSAAVADGIVRLLDERDAAVQEVRDAMKTVNRLASMVESLSTRVAAQADLLAGRANRSPAARTVAERYAEGFGAEVRPVVKKTCEMCGGDRRIGGVHSDDTYDCPRCVVVGDGSPAGGQQ